MLSDTGAVWRMFPIPGEACALLVKVVRPQLELDRSQPLACGGGKRSDHGAEPLREVVLVSL